LGEESVAGVDAQPLTKHKQTTSMQRIMVSSKATCLTIQARRQDALRRAEVLTDLAN
jgi:hypothetical protein